MDPPPLFVRYLGYENEISRSRRRAGSGWEPESLGEAVPTPAIKITSTFHRHERHDRHAGEKAACSGAMFPVAVRATITLAVG